MRLDLTHKAAYNCNTPKHTHTNLLLGHAVGVRLVCGHQQEAGYHCSPNTRRKGPYHCNTQTTQAIPNLLGHAVGVRVVWGRQHEVGGVPHGVGTQEARAGDGLGPAVWRHVVDAEALRGLVASVGGTQEPGASPAVVPAPCRREALASLVWTTTNVM